VRGVSKRPTKKLLGGIRGPAQRCYEKLSQKDESLFTKKTLLTISVQNPGNAREHDRPVLPAKGALQKLSADAL